MTQKGFIAPLHGLRGIAALTVLVGHFRGMTGVPKANLAPSLGVVLFFVLSGFLMGLLYLRKMPSPRQMESYVVARFARVYPLFASVILATVVLYMITGSTPFGITPADVVPHLFLAGAGGTVWTISVEFQFYGVFMLLWAGVALLPRFRAEAVLGLTVITVISVLLFGYPSGRIDFLRYAHVFLLGVSTAVILERHGKAVTALAPFILPAALAYYLAAFFVIPIFYDQNHVYGDMFTCLVCAMLVLFAAAAPTGERVGRFLSTRVMVLMGELSFGIYLLHRMVDFVWRRIDPFGLGGVSKWIILFVLTIAASWIANKLIEVPARSAIRKWHNSIRGAQITAT